MKYEKLMNEDGSFLIRQTRDNGTTRLVDEDYHGYVDCTDVITVPYVATEIILDEPDPAPPEKTPAEKLVISDAGMIHLCARMLEDIAEERKAEGKFMHEKVEEQVSYRKELRTQL